MVIAQSNLEQYFQESLHAALTNQHVNADDHTVFYLVNLLTTFARSEHFFDHTQDGLRIRALAELYAESVSTESSQERNAALQRLGDVALFMSGIFAHSFIRKLVDIDYYIAMGGTAYGYLSDVNNESTIKGRVLGPTFLELSQKFIDFVDVLAEIGEHLTASSNADILRIYEIWQKTGSCHAAKILRQNGIEPVELPQNPHRH